MSEYYSDKHKYDDIIHLSHHQSDKRIPMSAHDRAAQFAPFAALNGHEDAIAETARITAERTTLDEGMIAIINDIIFDISQHLSEKRVVSIHYFKSDHRKSGGAYLTDVGYIKKIDACARTLIMDSGMRIPMEEIQSIEYVEITK